MSDMQYISIRQFCAFHEVEAELIEELIESGLLSAVLRDETRYIPHEDIDAAEVAIRLRAELGINPAGIETILHMRQRMRAMQDRLHALERQLRDLRP